MQGRSRVGRSTRSAIRVPASGCRYSHMHLPASLQGAFGQQPPSCAPTARTASKPASAGRQSEEAERRAPESLPQAGPLRAERFARQTKWHVVCAHGLAWVPKAGVFVRHADFVYSRRPGVARHAGASGVVESCVASQAACARAAADTQDAVRRCSLHGRTTAACKAAAWRSPRGLAGAATVVTLACVSGGMRPYPYKG
jgi:hypothetical protein